MVSLKDRIIHEALRQFSSKGFMSTSISDILESVGASKGGLYNHFKSKEDLFFAALSEARKIWRQRNLAGLDHCDRPLGKLKQILEKYGFDVVEVKRKKPMYPMEFPYNKLLIIAK